MILLDIFMLENLQFLIKTKVRHM